MATGRELEIAYTLLPPPLSALPAKYWTSISLFLHSYTVARTFQELIKAYSSIKEAEVPSEEESFIIGFLHDMGQKLGLTGKSLENARKWVIARLQTGLGFNEREAHSFSKYMVTNVAETMRDPTYPIEVWRLLWLADRLQGTANIADIVSCINETRRDSSDMELVVSIYNILSPHPLLRAILHKIMYNTIIQAIEDGLLGFVLPISTPHGLIVLSDKPVGVIEFEWDEIRKLEEPEALLPGAVAKLYSEYVDYCKGLKGEKPKGWKKKNCAPIGSLKIGTYETVLLYYGAEKFSEKINKEIVLPSSFADQLIGIKIKDVMYSDGDYICPFCGARTPHGVYPSEIADIIGGAAKEKWSRRYPPVNLNVLLSRGKTYLACPLCLGEALLYNRMFAEVSGEKAFITLTLQTPVPVPVLEEIGTLLQHLVSKYGNKLISKEKSLEEALKLDNLSDMPRGSSTFAYDPFSIMIYGLTGLRGQKNIEIIVNGITLAGLLASWGFYPLVIAPVAPLIPSRKLLVFYKGQKTLYDFEPATDKQSEKYTPYVSLLLLATGYLHYRKFITEESLPAVTEVLDYPPRHAPHLLQYASPHLYSYLESLRLELEGGDV